MDYCYHCMAEITAPQNRFCPQCGKEHNVHYAQSFELPAGTHLCDGRYLVGKALGEGGFGITYIGFDKKLNKKIVIKETFYSGLSKRNSNNITSNDPLRVKYEGNLSVHEIMEKTQKECFSLSKAESVNNIVKVYDWFSENNTAYIITEFINGSTLYERVERSGAYGWNELYVKFKPLLQSLAQLHRMNLLHRDIKPHNIMLRQGYKSKVDFVLIDFGLARSNQSLASVAASTALTFTPGFSPPEQRTFAKQDGTYTDVYSLAATMYYALTGEVPNSSPTSDVFRNFPALKELRDEGKIPSNVYHAFVGALQPNYIDRCQTIDNFIELLDDIDEPNTFLSPYDTDNLGGRSEGDDPFATKKAGEGEAYVQFSYNSTAQSQPPHISRNVTQMHFQNSNGVNYVAQKPQKSKIPWVVLTVVLVMLLLGGSAVMMLSDGVITVSTGNSDNNDEENVFNTEEYIKLDNYVGRDIFEVENELEQQGLHVTYSSKFTTEFAENTVISQGDFAEGKYIEKGETVNLTVAVGEKEQSNVNTSSQETNSKETESKQTNSKETESKKSESKSGDASSKTDVSSKVQEVSSVSQKEQTVEYYYDDSTQNQDLTGTYTRGFFAEVEASSQLPANGGYTYVPKNVNNYKTTCWSENVEGTGEGEYIKYYGSKNVTISQCEIYNGYCSDKTTFNNNGRLKKVRFEFSNHEPLVYELATDWETCQSGQICYFNELINTTYIKIIIEEAIPGDKYEDTCISIIIPR